MPIYMKLGSVSGGAADQQHKGWIQLSGVSFEMVRSTSTAVGSVTNRGKSQPVVSEITCDKLWDKSDVDIIQTFLSNKTIGAEVNIDIVYDPDEQFNRRLVLKNAFCSSWSERDYPNQPSAIDFVIVYKEITVRDQQYDKDGNGTGPGGPTFNITTGKVSGG